MIIGRLLYCPLQISQSNGLFLRSVDTPRLTTLLIQRHSWAGPAALQRAQVNTYEKKERPKSQQLQQQQQQQI